MFSGKVSVFNRRLQLAHPAYELLRADTDESVETWALRPHPALPRHRETGVLEDRQGDPDRPAQRAGGARPPPGLAARRPRPGLPPRGPAEDPPPPHQGGHRRRPRPAEVGRGVRPPGRPRPPPPRRRPTPGRPPRARRRRPADLLRRPSPLHPHRGPAEGLEGDLRRPGDGPSDAPAAAGRGRFGQDPGRPARHARRGRQPAGRPPCSPPPRCSPSSTTAPSSR